MDTQAFNVDFARAQLVSARKALENCEEAVTIAQRKLDDTPEAKTLAIAKQQRVEAQRRHEEADALLRSVAIAMYNLDGQKKPCAGVEVKSYSGLEYDPAQAETWCREHAPTLLRLDKTRFEKVALDVGAPVTETEEPKVFIAKVL